MEGTSNLNFQEVQYKDTELKVMSFLEEIAQAASEENNTSILKNTWKLQESLKSSNFKVTFLGTRMAGKTSLINSLLEQETLPIGILKRNTLFSDISYSNQFSIKHSVSEKEEKLLSQIESQWEQFYDQLHENEASGTIKIGLDYSWLKEFNLEFFETPSIEYCNVEESDMQKENIKSDDWELKVQECINDTLIKSDGIIFVLNANMVLSETETKFINKYILPKEIPHMIMAIKRMDQLSEKNQNLVMNYVKEKLQSLGIRADVIDASNVDGEENIKNKIEEWVRDENHYKLKVHSICTQEIALINEIKEFLKKKKKKVVEDENLRKEGLKLQKESIDREGITWEKYELEMLKRCNECYKKMESEIIKNQESFIDELQMELSFVENLRDWWDRKYPYKLKSSISKLSSKLELILNEKYMEDIKWLNDAIFQSFQIMIKSQDNASSFRKETELESRVKPNFLDINKFKKLGRAGIGATTVLGFMFMGPFGSIVTVGGSLIAYEYFMKMNNDKQKQEIITAVQKDSILIIEDLKMEGKNWIDRLYDETTKEIRKQAETWIRNQYGDLQKINYAGKFNDEIKLIDNRLNKISELELIINKWIVGDDCCVN